ncbi:glutathione-independent formaldehyde dehydrogenase [Aspergillus lucknowensis]|uniref:Chaperonin 10-like protein n=1 Tax=Aspergillus lucknowensis TaxID=176173 RepID=A0ABR4M4V4_9EURO
MSQAQQKSMKAILWEGQPFHMALKNQPIPHIKDTNDVVIRITTAAICGTDLHPYHGLFGSRTVPWIMGHEGLGTIVEAGDGVKSLKVGDRVLAPGAIFCGYCDNCYRGDVTYCLTFNPPTLLDFPGFGDDFGPDLGGTQAEYIRVPFADTSCFKLPESTEHDLDYIILSDIFPTAWHAVDCAGFEAGDTVAVFGAGPVGLLTAYSALLRGARTVYVVDHVPSRLEKAASIGAIPIDFTKHDPVEQILRKEPRGVRRSIDCVGFECVNSKLEPEENIVFNNCIKVTEATGGIGLTGVYPPHPGKSAGTPLATEKQGEFPVLVGLLWFKGLSLRGGVAEIQRLQPMLQKLIESGKAKPSFIIGEVLHSLEEVPRAYERFSSKKIGKPVIQLSS